MNKIFTLVTVSALAASSFGSDAAADFSLASNPNGVWTYGWSSTLAGPLTLCGTTATLGPIIQWRGDMAADGNPSLFKNTTGSTIVSGTVTLSAFQLALHPGPNGEYSILRYTAAAAGLYSVSAGFIGQDATTTDVHVLLNGVSIYDNTVSGFGNSNAYAGTQSLLAGDTVDVRVGYGSNGSFFYDTTGVDFQVSAVPEPASLLALGLGAVALLRRRRA
ncbi:MAG: PEP-CTERM sorting domain-containing protein [Armatimonadetes bacterium]|nr:PEP-CTERM sorting domain-containing protein [Armatimonadota bacterium]